MTVHAEVIGDPISHSKSPLIHNFWIEKLGLDAHYERCHVTPDGLEEYFRSRRDRQDWRGCNVTIPHKQAVMPFLDSVDSGAARIGAVNTIVRAPDGALAGYNSDGAGFLEPLRPWLADRHLLRMARIIGSGGAARAIAHAFRGEGFTVAMIARDEGKARVILDEIGEKNSGMAATLQSWSVPIEFDWGDTEGRLDIVVNATSLGMKGNPPLAIDFSHVPPNAILYDIVYAPLETALLAEARRRGLRTIDGLEMLVGQAAVAFELFFGQPAPRHYDAELRTLLTS
jgi:shikimate dehydrogenase